MTKAVSSWSALALTVTYCNNIMLHEITEWNDQCYFKPDSHIETEDSDPIIIHQWYAQPSMLKIWNTILLNVNVQIRPLPQDYYTSMPR